MSHGNTIHATPDLQPNIDSTEGPIHKNFRVLVLGKNPETEEPTVVLKPVGKKLGTRTDGTDIKDYSLNNNSRRDIKPEETVVVDGVTRPNLDALADDETWVGNFHKLKPEEFHDAQNAEKYLKNPYYNFSKKAARRAIELVQNRTERLLLRGRMAIAGNRPPLGTPTRRKYLVDKQTGLPVIDPKTGEQRYRPGIEDLIPKPDEKPVSVRDFLIDIDRLEIARKEFTLIPNNGINPGEPGYVPKAMKGIMFYKTKDDHGIQPWEDGYTETGRWDTIPTRDEIEAYLSERKTKDTSDPRLDYFLKYPQLRAESKEPIYEDTLIDKIITRLQLKLGHSLGEMNTFSGETMIAMKNKGANEIVQQTQATGPDGILRALDKYPVNEHGWPVDEKTKKPIPMTELFKRQEMIHLVEHKSEIIIGLFNYAKTKWSPEQIAELAEYFFDIASEAHVPDDVFIGHMIGAFYGDKLEDNAWKNSSIVHPVKRYQTGQLKGHEIWNVKTDKKTNLPFYEDTNGKEWLESDLLTDPGTGMLYHDAIVSVDNSGNPVTEKVFIKYMNKKDPVTGRVVYETEADGVTLKKVLWRDEDGNIVKDKDGNDVYRNIPVKEPMKVMEPEYDMKSWVIGKSNLLSRVTEIGRRFRAGEFGFRESAMVSNFLMVAELAELMNESEYIPDFTYAGEPGDEYDENRKKAPPESLSFDDFRGRVNLSRAQGRNSELFRIAAYSLSMLWVGLSENLKQNYGGVGGDKGDDKDSVLKAFIERQMQLDALAANNPNMAKGPAELNPKFYNAPGISNQFLKEIVAILDATANRFPAIKKPPIGDSYIIGPNNQGQDILPLH